MQSRYLARFSTENPSAGSGSVVFCLSRMRMTTFSPKFIGPVATRWSMSMFFFVYFLKTMRPSWGRPLRDVQVAHDLQAGHEAVRHLLGQPELLEAHAVNPVADEEV